MSLSLGSLICPLRHQRAPQINVPLRHQGPNFPFSSPGHLAPHRFLVALLRVCNFPIASSRGKGPWIFHWPSRVHSFLIMLSKWWPLVSYHVIMWSHLSLSHQGPPFPHCVIKGTQISKIHDEMCTDWKVPCLKSYNRDKRVQSLSKGVCGGRVKGIRLSWSMGKGPGESVVHGLRTSMLRHWDKCHTIKCTRYLKV